MHCTTLHLNCEGRIYSDQEPSKKIVQRKVYYTIVEFKGIRGDVVYECFPKRGDSILYKRLLLGANSNEAAIQPTSFSG